MSRADSKRRRRGKSKPSRREKLAAKSRRVAIKKPTPARWTRPAGVAKPAGRKFRKKSVKLVSSERKSKQEKSRKKLRKKPKKLTIAHKKAISRALKAHAKRVREEIKRRSERRALAHAKGVRTKKRKKKEARAWERARDVPEERAKAVRTLALRAGTLPRIRGERRKIHTVFREGFFEVIQFGVPLTLAVVNDAYERAKSVLWGMAKAGMTSFLAVVLLFSYGTDPRGPSPKVDVMDVHVPDAREGAFDPISSGVHEVKGRLTVASVVEVTANHVEDTLEAILEADESEGSVTYLEGVQLSGWNERSEEERKGWTR